MLAPRPCQTYRVSDRRQRLAQASLYLVCHAAADEFLAGALRGGVQIVQLRCKHADDDAVLIAAPRFASLCEAHGALFILNDRPDLALRAEADGVHLGQGDMPVADAIASICISISSKIGPSVSE